MGVLIYNIGWMIWNIELAVVAIIVGILMVKLHIRLMKYLFFLGWLLFIPNTVYVITDSYHILPQLSEVPVFLYPYLTLEYLALLVVGIFTFVIGLKLFEIFLTQLKIKTFSSSFIICIFNFFISFGVMLGRFQRTNSWEVITNPKKVFYDTMALLFTPEYMIFVLSFGFFCCVLYFGLRNRLKFVSLLLTFRR